MKNRYFIIVFLLINTLKADQEETITVSVKANDNDQSVHIAQCVDTNQAQWSKIKHDFKEGKLFESLFTVIKYFKKRINEQQTQLDEQKKQIELIITNQTAATKKQESDSNRHDQMYKHMQQSFVAQNRYAGG